MNEKITHISMHFMDDDISYQAKIVIDGIATPHYIDKGNVKNQKEFILITLANALGFEPADILYFDNENNRSTSYNHELDLEIDLISDRLKMLKDSNK